MQIAQFTQISKRGFKTSLRSILKIICRNKKDLTILVPIFILNVLLFLPLYTLSKVPYDILSCNLGTGLTGSNVYFVHGYNGNDSQFQDMIDYLYSTDFFERNLNKNITPLFFNYYQKYYAQKMTKVEIHNVEGGISAYAKDFYEQLCSSHTIPTQIDIVAHSIGGLITREMLRTYKAELEDLGIRVTRVVTLGTPHLGTEIPNHPLAKSIRWFFGRD
ncbi:MAG: esterase/lipase family protein, partial [Candidatus Hodarchaeales archaeon]